MTRKAALGIVVGVLACGMWATGASAKRHRAHHAHAATQSAAPAAAKAETIPGVNPMTNAGPTPAVENKAKYEKVPGVNPM